ncbi:hypothetical protein AWH56_020965 [Anaerobacillus isosaccharinicus]|uniref:Ferredoxin--nitrite reductase n=1 Tax=Anaerobacillus isosaccharinicus TaxID=1532552 RepID=A0A1S2LJN5_9BACI|nr:hypothetical protein [Anaerobacillus isosaccharinicus]MBA5586619.1 ferredoxin--nitrite reductase [Anaerobacillus isosaccharinicus]QOY35147.1 ferredoxin--nitrite reductase [Anaerobacillus isosaccharinicus]
MNRMEKLKSEKEGLAVLSDIYVYAKRTIAEIPDDDLFRMRWYGFFYRKSQSSFMVRIRVPSGKLTSKQAEQVAYLAERYGDGTVAITTRMGLQIRKISLEHIPTVWETLQEIGLDTRQTGFDNIRNYMNCPVAGLQENEAFDASDVITELTRKTLGNPAYTNLPRKFNISVTGCHEDCGHSRISDIGLIPQVIYAENEFKEGFRVRLGGALGRFYAAAAEDLGVWLPKEQAVEFVLTVLELFRDHGKRTNRKMARLHHLKEELGLDQIREELNLRLSLPLIKMGVPLSKANHHDHIGIYRQKQKGFVYVGLTVPTGKMMAHQFRELARLATHYGKEDLRLTAQQNVIIPHILEQSLESFKKENLLKDFSYQPSVLLRGLVACTGKEGCDLALVTTKSAALNLVNELENQLKINRNELRIHWSGCANSCAIIQTGDIGLHGTDLEVNGKYVEAVNIYYGGEIGPNAKIGTLIREKVLVSDLTDTLIEILTDKKYFTGIELRKTF